MVVAHATMAWGAKGFLCPSEFFLLAKFRQKANFFYLWPIFGEIWTQKKHFCRQKFIHFDHFSSI
jgi:hypothetical protein